jgi:energy-converting hydrogenase Eha subunit H
LSSYIKNIALVMGLLSLAAVGMAHKLDLYHWTLGLGVVVFMGVNALGAVWPLYRFPAKNPFTVYLGGMALRLALIGTALILVISLGNLSTPHLLAMTVTAMASYVAYLSVEVRHFLNHTAFTKGR